MSFWQKIKCRLGYHQWIHDFAQMNYTVRDPHNLTGLDGLVTKRSWCLIRECTACHRGERLAEGLGWVKL